MNDEIADKSDGFGSRDRPTISVPNQIQIVDFSVRETLNVDLEK